MAVSSYHCVPICSIANCLVCSDTTKCRICKDGFRLQSDTACVLRCIIPNCEICQNIDNCQTCATGYSRVVDSFGKGVCRTPCTLGFFNNSGTCTLCSLNGCEACSAATLCISCKPTYYLTSNTCALCSATYNNCLICDSSSCIQCQPNFAKNSQGACIALSNNCTRGCLSCSSGECN